MALRWKKYSLPAASLMKPNPFSARNVLIVPVMHAPSGLRSSACSARRRPPPAAQNPQLGRPDSLLRRHGFDDRGCDDRTGFGRSRWRATGYRFLRTRVRRLLFPPMTETEDT